MSDDEPTPKKGGSPPPPKYPNYLGSISEGLAGTDWETISRSMRGLQEGLAKGLAGEARIVEATGSASGSSSAKAEGLQPAIAGGDSGEKKRPRNRPKRTSLDRIPGRRAMKEYPVTGEELLTLGIMQGGAALMLAFAGTCFGFSLSTQQTIDFAGKEVSAATVGWWSGMGDAAFVLAIVAAVLGVALGVLSGFKVSRIMKGTDHG